MYGKYNITAKWINLKIERSFSKHLLVNKRFVKRNL